MGFLWFGGRKPKTIDPAPTSAVTEDLSPFPRASEPVIEEQPPAPASEPIPVAAQPAVTEHESDPPPSVEAEAESEPEPEPEPAPTQPTPDEALQRLKAGNAAFLSGATSLGQASAHDLEPLQGGQQPIAVIVGCADSRTSPDILFDQGFGRLFTIRVAGNTVDARGLSSIIYAVHHLHAPLIVVMGHTGCGAVAAAGAVVDGAPLDPSLEAMLTPILPPVLAARRDGGDPVAANARWVAQKLGGADPALANAVSAGRIRIVAAVMDLGTGRVDFLD